MAPIEGEFTIRKGFLRGSKETVTFKGQDDQDLMVQTVEGAVLHIKWSDGNPILRASGFVMGPHSVTTCDIEGKELSRQSFDLDYVKGYQVSKNESVTIERDGFEIKATRT